MNEWKNKKMNEWMDKWTNEQMNKKKLGPLQWIQYHRAKHSKYTDAQNEWMDKWINEWMNEWRIKK